MSGILLFNVFIRQWESLAISRQVDCRGLQVLYMYVHDRKTPRFGRGTFQYSNLVVDWGGGEIVDGNESWDLFVFKSLDAEEERSG